MPVSAASTRAPTAPLSALLRLPHQASRGGGGGGGGGGEVRMLRQLGLGLWSGGWAGGGGGGGRRRRGEEGGGGGRSLGRVYKQG